MKGFTILELMISTFLLGLLLAAVFLIYFQGAKAWRQSDAHSDVQQQGAILLAQLSKEIEQSCQPGVTLGPQSIALLSAADVDGRFQFTNAGSPAWAGYVLFYKDSDDLVLRLNLMAPTPVAPPTPIETTDMGSGLNPLTSYLAAGRPVARMVQDLNLSLEPNNRGIRVQAQLSNGQPGLAKTAQLQLDSTIVFRN